MAKKTNYTKNGIDYYRVTLTIGKDDKGKPIRKEFYGTSKKDAENKKNEYLKMIELGINPELAKQHLSEAMHIWLWEIEKNSGHKPATFERYEGIYRNYIKDSEIGILKVADLKALTIQKYYNNLAGKNKTHSQIDNLNKLLNKFFNYAYNEGYINRNPCKGAKVPVKKSDKKVEIFTNDEIQSILDALQGNRLECFVKLALGTGMREGELLALTWNDIDLKNMTIDINKSAASEKTFINENEWEYILTTGDPKNFTSKRKIPFPSHLLNDIKQQKRNNTEDRLKAGDLYNKESNLVFSTALGGQIDNRNFVRAHKRIIAKAKVEYKKFHTYRHTFVSLMQAAGVPLEVISHLIGHSTFRTTVDTYLHVSVENAGKAMNNMNNLFNNVK